MNERISLITVCYNSANTIRDTLASVARQTVAPFQHVVVDGGSRDGTLEILSRWNEHPLTWISGPDGGIYDAMNKGLRMVVGDVVGFLNSDDVLAHEQVLSRIARIMEDRSVDAYYADVIYVDQKDLGSMRRRWRSGHPRVNAIPMGWIPAHPTFYARRSIYERFGGFDTRYRLAADHECLSRFLYRYRICAAYDPEVCVKMRLGGATNVNWGNIVNQNREIIAGMRANHIPVSPLFPIWKLLDRIRQRWNRTVPMPGLLSKIII